MKKWLTVMAIALGMVLTPSLGNAQTAFYTDRAVGVSPFGNGGIASLIPIQYGQVRVCSFPAVGSPCSNPASITDLNGQALTIVGGNFGQLNTDVVGRFSFGCTLGTNYQVQVAASSTNTPALNYPVTCPGAGFSPVFGAITVSSVLSSGAVTAQTYPATGGGSPSTPAFTSSSETNSGWFRQQAGIWGFSIAGSYLEQFTSNRFNHAPGVCYSWAPGAPNASAGDVSICRSGVGGLEIGDGTANANGNLLLNGLTSKSANGTQKAEQFAGATADVKIAACLTAVSSGGTCDARGFGATTQSIAATITVANHESLLFDPATNFQAASSALTLFTFQPGSIVKGFNFDCTNQPSYTGVMFQNDTTKAYGNWDLTELGDISTTLSCAAVTGFTALKLTSSSNTLGVSFVKFHGWRIIGGTDGIFMTTTSTGFVNGNHFSDMVWSNTAHGWHITGVTGGAIQGNVCTPCSFEKDAANGVNGVLIDGTSGQVDGNQWYGSIWDTTVPVSVTNSGASVLKNLFAGYMNGSPSDVNSVNNFIYTSNSTLLPNIVFEGARINTVGNSFDLFDPTSGATTPHKFIRVGQGAGNGVLEILNSAFGTDIMTLSDSGSVTFAGTGTFSGNAITGGSSGLTINAGGSAQNVTLVPSGAGVVNISAGGGLFINGSVLSDLSRNITAGTGAFSGVITSTKATGTAPFTITSTTPVANLTASAALYGTTGTQAANSHFVTGVCTLGTNCGVTLSGSAVYTSSASYQCTANDASAAAAVQVNQVSGSAVTFTGTGTDVIRFSCAGN